jgi:hypothetical protein
MSRAANKWWKHCCSGTCHFLVLAVWPHPTSCAINRARVLRWCGEDNCNRIDPHGIWNKVPGMIPLFVTDCDRWAHIMLFSELGSPNRTHTAAQGIFGSVWSNPALASFSSPSELRVLLDSLCVLLRSEDRIEYSYNRALCVTLAPSLIPSRRHCDRIQNALVAG